MKIISYILAMTTIVILFFSSCHHSQTKDTITMVSDDTILPDSVNVFWGDISRGDTIVYSSCKHLPLLKNLSNTVIDTFFFAVKVVGITDLSQISKYYKIDSVGKEEGIYSVSLVYEKTKVNPYEVIPFPLKYSSNENLAVVLYSYYYNKAKSKKGKVGHSRLVLVKYSPDIVSDYNLQYDFMDLSRRFLNPKNLGCNVFIFRDTLVEVKRYDMLSGNDMKARKLTDLQ